MANLGDLAKDLNDKDGSAIDAVGAAFGTIADFGGAITSVIQLVELFLPQDNQLADILTAIQSDFEQIDQILGAEDKLERMRDIDSGINPAVGVLQQLPDILQNISSLPPAYILQQIQTCLDAVIFFDVDDKWQAVDSSVPLYKDLWSGALAPPSSGGLVFNYSYTLPQYMRAINILLVVIQALEPSSLSSYKSTFAQSADRLQTVHDTIVSTGIVGTKLPEVEDVGSIDTNAYPDPIWVSQWQAGSVGYGITWPYGAVEIYSAANNVGTYFPFINSPILLYSSPRKQWANFLKLLQFRIELQKKALYLQIGLPVVRRTINYLRGLSGQPPLAQDPYEECSLAEASSLLGIAEPAPGTAALQAMRAFLSETPPYASWWAFDLHTTSSVPNETRMPGRPIPAPGKLSLTLLEGIKGPGWPYPNPSVIIGLIG
jgi:hypothetical protein